MSSPAKQTSLIRKRKKMREGTRRKAAINTNGSTKSYEELFGEEKK